MIRRNTVVSLDRRIAKDLWVIPSDKNWYLIKLLSGIPSNNVNINSMKYCRLFMPEKETVIIKLVDDVGTLEVL